MRGLLVADPACRLAAGSPGDLHALLGVIDQRQVDHAKIERYTRRWAIAPLRKVAIEAAVVANRLRVNGRTDLAAMVALATLRAAVCQIAAVERSALADASRRLHAADAVALLDRYEPAADDPLELMNTVRPGFVHVTYPATCLRLAETWGLLGLAPHADATAASRARSATAALLINQPGAAHPVSDRWTISLIPAVLATVWGASSRFCVSQASSRPTAA